MLFRYSMLRSQLDILGIGGIHLSLSILDGNLRTLFGSKIDLLSKYSGPNLEQMLHLLGN